MSLAKETDPRESRITGVKESVLSDPGFSLLGIWLETVEFITTT